MTDTEPGRLTAHVMLDAVGTFDGSTPDEESRRIADLAMARLGEIGCVTATYDDDTDEVDIDARPLLGGMFVLVHALVERIAQETGLPREVVVSQTREIIDRSM